MHMCELGRDRFACWRPRLLSQPLVRSERDAQWGEGVRLEADPAGDEIVIDYRLNAFDGDTWPCCVRERNCSGVVVGSFFALPVDVSRRILRYAFDFIQREYRRRQRARCRRRLRSSASCSRLSR